MNRTKVKNIFSSDVRPQFSPPLIISTFIIGTAIRFCICHYSGQVIAFFASINFKSFTFVISWFRVTVILNPESPGRPKTFGKLHTACINETLITLEWSLLTQRLKVTCGSQLFAIRTCESFNKFIFGNLP